MAQSLPPIPNNPITDTFVWRDWFFKVSQLLVQQASIAWTSLDFTGSNLLNIQTRQHNALQAVQGGNSAEEYHLTAAEHASVVALPTFGTMATQNANAVNITGGTITGISGLGMTYPGAGIANSTGSAWGTSYTTSGSGTVVALASSPVFATNITVNSILMGAGVANITNNLGLGINALSNASTTGADNVAIGTGTLPVVTTAAQNTAIGSGALSGITTGSANVGIGYQAGASITSGNGNLIIGQSSGGGITTQTNNMLLGGAVFTSSACTRAIGVGNSIGTASAGTVTDTTFIG